MPDQAATLLMKVRVDSADAQRQIGNIYKIAANIQKQAGDTTVRVSRETTRQQIANDKARQIAAAQVAVAIAKSEANIQKAAVQTGKARETAAKQATQSLKSVLRDIDGQIAAEKRLDNQTATTARRVGSEYDRMARSADKSFDTIVKGYQRAGREAAKAQGGGASAASQFVKGVKSTRFDLPGTNGAVQPLIGAAFAGGPASFLGSAAVSAGSFALGQMRDGVKLAADLEANLNVLQQATGATDSELEQLRKTARDLGADMTLPATSSNDAAKAMLELSKNGLSVNDVMAAGKGVLQLSAAASIDAGDAAKYVAVQLNAFGLSGSKATEIADLLAAAGKQSSASVHDLGVAGQQAASAYHAAGFTVSEMTADILQMAKAGIIGSDAGTSLRTAINRLQTPTKEGAEQLKKYGIEIYNNSGQLLSHREIITNVTRGLSGLSQQQRATAVQTIFGQDAQRAANIVFAKGTKINDDLAKQINQTGAAAKAAAAHMKGYNGAVDGLNSALDSFKEKRAAPFLGFLAGVVRDGTKSLDILDGFADRLQGVEEAGNKPVKKGSVLEALLNGVSPGLGTGLKTIMKNIEAGNEAATNANTDATRAKNAQRTLDLIGKARAGKTNTADVHALMEGLRALGVDTTVRGNPGEYQAMYDHGENRAKGILQGIREAQQETQRFEGRRTREGNMAPYRSKPGVGGGTSSASFDDLIAEKDSVRAEGAFGRLVELYGKEGKAGQRGQLEGLINRLYDDAVTIAKAKLKADQDKGDPRAQGEYEVQIAKINEERTQRLDQVKKAEGELAEHRKQEAKEAAKQAEQAAKKTREDKEQAAIIRAERQASTTKQLFDQTREMMDSAKTPEEAKKQWAALLLQNEQMFRNEVGVAMAKKVKDIASDPNNPRAARETYLSSIEKAKDERRGRDKEISDGIEKANKRFLDEANEAADKAQEYNDKQFKRNAQQLKEHLDIDNDDLETARQKSKSLEEEARIIEMLVDNKQRQAVLDAQIAFAEENVLDSMEKAADVATAFTTGGFTGIAGGIGAAFVKSNALGRFRTTTAGIGDFQAKAIQEAQDREADRRAVYLNADSNDGEGVGVTHTFTDKYGIEHTVAGPDPGTSKARVFGRGVEQDFQSSAANLLAQGATGGKLDANTFKEFALGFGKDFANKASETLVGELSKNVTKSFQNFFKSADLSAKNLLAAGLALGGLANLLGANGKKKQKGGILGGVLGLAIGSLIPGGNALTDIGIGAFAGGFLPGFADGGRPPLGRASWVGERGPELLVPSQPSIVLNGQQIAAVNAATGGGSGDTFNFNGPIYDRLDTEIVQQQMDRKRQTKALVGR